MNRISEQVAEVERLKDEITSWQKKKLDTKINNYTFYRHAQSTLKISLQIFKAESKNIIARATDELEFVKTNNTDYYLKFCECAYCKREIKIKQEIKQWESHLEWLEEQ